MSNPQEESKPSAGLLQAAKATVDEWFSILPARVNPKMRALRQAIAAEEERGAEDDLSIHTYPWKTTAARDLLEERDQLRKELEHEQIRLAACGVAAMANLDGGDPDRLAPDHPSYSASYGDVCRAVDREVALRKELEATKKRENDGVALFDKLVADLREKLEAGKLDAKILQLINESLGTAGSGNAAACLNEVRRLKKAEASGVAKLKRLVGEIEFFQGVGGEFACTKDKVREAVDRLRAEPEPVENLSTGSQIDNAEPEQVGSSVRELVLACDRMRDNWAESSPEVQQRLWRNVHSASAKLHDRVYPLRPTEPEPAAERGEDGPLRVVGSQMTPHGAYGRNSLVVVLEDGSSYAWKGDRNCWERFSDALGEIELERGGEAK